MDNLSSQTEEALGWAAEADKYIDNDIAPSKDITFMDAAKFVAELTPVIGDAMAAKEVYDELQKDDPNYFLAGALGGATIIGLIPGIGDVAAKAIKKGARNFFDVAKRIEVDSNTLGTNLGNVNLKPKEPFKKTQNAYRIATQSEDGKLYPLFVNASDEIPVGQWVSATIPPITFKGANGNMYVPSKGAKRSKGEKAKPTGDMQALPDKETANNLKEAGFSVERPSKKYPFGRVRAVASRPGFHATTKPVAHHLGPEDLIVSSTERDKLLAAGITPKAFKSKTFNYLDGKLISKKQVANLSEKDKKRVTSQKKYYVKRRAEDQVFIEVEMADDTSEDLIKYMQERGRKDIDDKLPSGGSYKYTEGQADAETWVIGGDMKVTRVLSREEAKAAQDAMGVKDLPYRDEVEKILGRNFYNGGLVGENMFTGQQDYLLSSDAMQMNEGGVSRKNKEEDQMIMAFMVDDGKDVDPVSGNEVPPGSLAKEVRDDIPAQLSEGEYVVPADVLRFYGMKFFEDLRENAKMELARMDREGRIGGQPVPANDNELTPEEMAELDSIGAAVGGFITGQPSQSTMPDPYQQQQMMYRQGAPVAMGNAGYQTGGLAQNVDPTQAQFDFSKYAAGFSFATPSGFTPVLMYKEGENPKYATTQEMYDQMLGDGWTTKLIDITTESKVSEELKVEDNDPGVVGSTDISSITDSIEDKDLEKTTKGLGLLADLSTALAGTLGIPATALINAKAVAAYNDKLTDQSKRKGSIFGGEGSIYEGLTDVSGDKERNFADTWLGDLLGFDKKVGVQGPKLRDSFMGARRGFDMTQLEGSNTSDKDSGGSTYSPSNSAEAQKDWMQATNAVKAAGNDHLARHKAIKAQSEASKKFTELKRAETSRAKDPSKVDPEAI